MDLFCELGPKGERILTAADVPYGIPLVLSQAYKLEKSTYESYAMHAQIAVSGKSGSKMQFLAEFRESTNIESAYRELVKKVAEQKKDKKVEVKETALEEFGRSAFDFYLPKRLCEVISTPERLADVNKKRLLGYFVGKRGVSICIVMVPLECATKSAGKKKAVSLNGDEESARSSGKRKYAISTPVIALSGEECEEIETARTSKKQNKGEKEYEEVEASESD